MTTMDDCQPETTPAPGIEGAHLRTADLLENISDGFFAVDRQWRFTYVNRQAEKLLRRPRQDGPQGRHAGP